MFVPLSPVRCLYRGVDLYPAKIAVVCGNRRLTYAEFGERCERLAGAVRASGAGEGDRVAFLSFNNHQLLEGYFGVPMAQATVMPLNVRLSPQELIGILNHSGACMLFFETDFAPLVEQIRRGCPGIARAIALDREYEELLAGARRLRPDVMDFDENAIAELFYTSGSTGTPKGVMLSHRSLYLHALGVSATFYKDDSAVELHTIPLFHANGWGRPQAATMNGLKQVMVRRFDPAMVFSLIEREGATCMLLVPTMAGALLNSAERGKHDCSSLREIHIGGAAASPEVIARLEEVFHCAVMAGYGLTETCPVATSARPKCTQRYASETDRLRCRAMAGWPLPGVEIRVVDARLRDVPRDLQTIGEVIIRGDEVMEGYFQDPQATAAAVTPDGWLHTGDMAVWDRESCIQIVDRQKDIIISGGENISSLEIERAISMHPSVLECAVVAAPDPKWGEVPAAFVSVKPGETLTRDELQEFLEARLARFKVPRAYHLLDEALPKTGTGKILKRELRERFWKGMATRVQG